MAAAIIRGAGLERYYQDREEFAPRPGPLRPGWDAVPVTLCDDGSAEVRLVLDGLRCASCVWVTEHILQATPGVEEATVSYATGRASLRWDPEAVDLGTLAGKVAALGYRPRLLGEESKPDQGLVIRLGVATFAAMNIMMMSAALYLGWVSAMDARCWLNPSRKVRVYSKLKYPSSSTRGMAYAARRRQRSLRRSCSK